MYLNVQKHPERASELLWRLLRGALALLAISSMLSLFSFSSINWRPLAAIRRIEVSIVSALLIDDAIACLESSAASFFWNCNLYECQSSFWLLLKRLDRELPNFSESSSMDGNIRTPAPFKQPLVNSDLGLKLLSILSPKILWSNHIYHIIQHNSFLFQLNEGIFFLLSGVFWSSA